MHRLAAFLLCSFLVAVTATAAPAPVYKPQPSKQWVTGWDKPIDNHGDCRLDRNGDKLTLTVPRGKARYHDVLGGRRDAPYLVRDVAGDFTVQVRVDGDFGPPGGRPRGAGLLLMGGKDSWILLRGARQGKAKAEHRFLGYCAGPFPGAMTECSYPVTSPVRKSYLRLERRGNNLLMQVSQDGVKWTRMYEQTECALPKSFKVGVLAQAGSDGSLKAVFDQFKVTPVK